MAEKTKSVCPKSNPVDYYWQIVTSCAFVFKDKINCLSIKVCHPISWIRSYCFPAQYHGQTFIRDHKESCKVLPILQDFIR